MSLPMPIRCDASDARIYFCVCLGQSSRNCIRSGEFLLPPTFCCWPQNWWGYATSLAVQWLRLHAPNAGGTGSIPGWGTNILHTAWRGHEKKKIKLIGLSRGCQEQCFRSRSIQAVSFHHTMCFMQQRERWWKEKAGLGSQCVGRLLLPPCPGWPGHWSGWSGPSSRREGKSKRQVGERKAPGEPFQMLPAVSSEWNNGCLVFSKTDRKGTWNLASYSGFQLVLHSQAVQTISFFFKLN